MRLALLFLTWLFNLQQSAADICSFCLPQEDSVEATNSTKEYCSAIVVCKEKCITHNNETSTVKELPNVIVYCDKNNTLSSPHDSLYNLSLDFCSTHCRNFTPDEAYELQQMKRKYSSQPVPRPLWMALPMELPSITLLHLCITFCISAFVCIIFIYKSLRWLDNQKRENRVDSVQVSLL